MIIIGRRKSFTISFAIREALDRFAVEIRFEIEANNYSMNKRLSDLEDIVSSLVSRLSATESLQKKTEFVDIQAQTGFANIPLSMNEEERRLRNRCLNCRIRGLCIPDGHSCIAVVLNLLRSNLQLDVDMSDLVSVRHLKSKISSSEVATSIFVVRFARTAVKQAVMQRRKCLKGTGISIFDDLSKEDLALLKTMRAKDDVLAAWSWNGKIFARLSNGTKIIARSTTT